MDGGTEQLCMNKRRHLKNVMIVKNSNKQSLNVHIKSVHEQKKPFKCDECDKAFF